MSLNLNNNKATTTSTKTQTLTRACPMTCGECKSFNAWFLSLIMAKDLSALILSCRLIALLFEDAIVIILYGNSKECLLVKESDSEEDILFFIDIQYKFQA